MDKIYNPQTRQSISIFTKKGQFILKKYIQQLGGSAPALLSPKAKSPSPKTKSPSPKGRNRKRRKSQMEMLEDTMTPKQLTLWEKTKLKFKKAGKGVWNHKGKIIAGLIAVGAIYTASQVDWEKLNVESVTKSTDTGGFTFNDTTVNEDVFSNLSKRDIGKKFRELSKILHPDKGGNAELFEKLNEMRESALNVL